MQLDRADETITSRVVSQTQIGHPLVQVFEVADRLTKTAPEGPRPYFISLIWSDATHWISVDQGEYSITRSSMSPLSTRSAEVHRVLVTTEDVRAVLSRPNGTCETASVGVGPHWAFRVYLNPNGSIEKVLKPGKN